MKDLVIGHCKTISPYTITINLQELFKQLKPPKQTAVATGCPYCDLKWCGSDLDYGKEIEAINNRSDFAHVVRDSNSGNIYFEVEGLLFEIEFCPKCGRRLV